MAPRSREEPPETAPTPADRGAYDRRPLRPRDAASRASTGPTAIASGSAQNRGTPTGGVPLPSTQSTDVEQILDSKALERLERLMPLLSSMQLDDTEYLAWEGRLRAAAGVAPDAAIGPASTAPGAPSDGAFSSTPRPGGWTPTEAPDAYETPHSATPPPPTTESPTDGRRASDEESPPTNPTDAYIGPPSAFSEPRLAYPRLSSTGPVPRLDEPIDDEYVYEPNDTHNTGSIPINTGSVPVVTVVDPDLADDADDVWQPEEVVLSAGSSAPVAPPLTGQDTGPITPILTPRLDEETPLLLPNEVAKARRAFSIEEPSVEPTPLEERVGRATRMFWLWFAPNASVVTLALGASLLAMGISLRQALVATLVGTLIACLPLGITVLGAKRTGQPMAVASRATFGVVGNLLPAALQVIIRLAWAAVLLWLAGSSVRSVVLEAGWDIFVPPPIAAPIGLAVVAILGIAVATFGYWLLARVQLVVTAIAAVSVALVIGFTAPLVDLSVALSRPDGSWPLLAGGAAAVLSVLATAWLASGGETARYQRTQTSGSSTVAWAAFGGALPAIVLTGWGALLAASSDSLGVALSGDPITALADQMPIWFPIPLLLAVIASLLAGVSATVYSGGLTLPGAGVPLGRVPSTLLFGVLAAVLGGLGLALSSNSMPLAFSLLPTVAVPVLAWAGIVCTDLLTRNRAIDGPALLRRGDGYPDYRVLNLVALLVISIIGIGFLSSSEFGFEGYLWNLIGVDPAGALARSDVGLVGALLLGLLVPLVGGLRPERSASVSDRGGRGVRSGPRTGSRTGPRIGRRTGASSAR